jgi:hypothetical protein
VVWPGTEERDVRQVLPDASVLVGYELLSLPWISLNGDNMGLDPKLETLKIETHCSERRFGWQVPEFSGWNFGLQYHGGF